MAEREALELLTGPEAGPILRTAFSPHVVRSWQVRSVNHRPGAGVSVGYDAVLCERRGTGDDARSCRSQIRAVASTLKVDSRKLRMAGGVRLQRAGRSVSVWRLPMDPELPGLSVAASDGQMSHLLGAPATAELLAYRPTRRAVVQVDLQAASNADSDVVLRANAGVDAAAGADEPVERLFAKVVRPEHYAALASRYRAAHAANLPVPEVAYSDQRGILATRALSGTPLYSGYAKRTVGDRTFDSLTELLDALPLTALGMPKKDPWAKRAASYARAAASALPEYSDRIKRVGEQVLELRSRAELGPVVPTHGDFYEANVFIDDRGEVSGLLDLDALGPGYRADDLGCLLGHLSVLPTLAVKYCGVEELCDRWFSRAGTQVDPDALAAAAAGVVLSLVTSARQRGGNNWREHALARLAVAEGWLARAS